MSNKRKVEIFSAGCGCCEDTIKLVKSTACPSCDITILDMKQPEIAERAKHLGVRSVPAVVIDGKLAGCCAERGPEEAGRLHRSETGSRLDLGAMSARDDRPAAVLFDVDETLITTGGAGARSWRWAFDHLWGVEADITKFTSGGMTDCNGSASSEYPDCYGIESHMQSGTNWGSYFWWGGSGRNANCP